MDSILIEELQQRGAFATDPDNPEQGTALTRLYEELGYITGEGGPLRGIDATIGKFLDTLNAEAARREQQPVDALRDLRGSKRTGFNLLGVWVESYQQAARTECAEYINWYQKRSLLKDMQQGFFADPIYGGNRDMCAWKMIGFPGARYNYLDWIERHNERFPLPPVSILGRSDWTSKAH